MDEFLEEEGKLGHGFTSADLLEENGIRDGDRPRPTFISANLDPEYKQELKSSLREYKDCFAWEYYEMPGLDRSIIEHRLPIKPGYRPYQQGAIRCKPKILLDIKAEMGMPGTIRFSWLKKISRRLCSNAQDTLVCMNG